MGWGSILSPVSPSGGLQHTQFVNSAFGFVSMFELAQAGPPAGLVSPQWEKHLLFIQGKWTLPGPKVYLGPGLNVSSRSWVFIQWVVERDREIWNILFLNMGPSLLA